MYYNRFDVRAALLNFTRTTEGTGVRETAIYNSRTHTLQRYLGNNGSKHPVQIHPENIDDLVSMGAVAFFCSYWRYSSLDFQNPIGRDLVWIVRAEKGGLKATKETVKYIIEILRSLGVEAWLKYDGDRGFDIIIPLEAIPYEGWMGDLSALDEIQHQLTDFIASHLDERFPNSQRRFSDSSLRIEMDSGVCLLSELRVRRGLLLAPMSLNPKTDLISVPITPEQLETFTVLNATKEHVQPTEWKLPEFPSYSLMRFAPVQMPTVLQAIEA